MRGGSRRMLTMAQVDSIREMFFEKGMSYAEIARTTGHDVKTVKKYIAMDDFNELPLA
jgi:DNA-binding CsgD family transcriptional regulator